MNLPTRPRSASTYRTVQTLGGWRSESMPRYYTRSALERVALKRARQAGVRLWE